MATDDATLPTDGAVWITRLRPGPASPDEVADRAAELAATGAELVLLANVQDQLLGHEPRWGSVEVTLHPATSDGLGVDGEIEVRGRPYATPDLPADAPPWAQVPHPPTEDDPDVVVLHLIRFNEGGARGDMVSYQDAAGRVAVPHGVRIDGWFHLDATLSGDGRTWDQVRFNAFPSRAAFMAVVFDPARMEAHTGHREVAIADTYTLVLRPIVDRLAARNALADVDR